ncbi:MAG: hypothetical protein WCD89_25495 [Anaerocolumna sp.]
MVNEIIVNFGRKGESDRKGIEPVRDGDSLIAIYPKITISWTVTYISKIRRIFIENKRFLC